MSFTVDGTSGLTFPNSTTQASAGGMTLLGTLTTTSGTTQTLSGLTLTNYKFLQISFNNVGFTSGSSTQFRIAGVDVTYSGYASTTTACYGIVNIDLATGATAGAISSGYQNTGTSNYINPSANSSGPISGNLSTISTSTTSIAFTFAGGNTFASGTIKVYGVA